MFGYDAIFSCLKIKVGDTEMNENEHHSYIHAIQ